LDIITASPLSISGVSIALLFLIAITAPFFTRKQVLMITLSFYCTAVASLLGAVAGILAVNSGIAEQSVLPIGLPDLPFHMRLDALSGFFMTVTGLLSFFVSIYSIGYVKGFVGVRSVTRLIVFYCIFIAGMFMVVLANDALFFLVSWEVMAVSSYFLVMFEDEKTANRRAAFLYMVVAHIGAIAILLSFGVMAGLSVGFENFSGFTFDAMRQAHFPIQWATAAFLLAFFGFAAKAGAIPLHVWLPEAHPVAPSNISALMSGVMLKTAIYGILRVTFDLIRDFPWWWGAIVLTTGLLSAVMGVLYALMQHDLKRLLAYSSVENIGIILSGIGLAMIFVSFNLPIMAALAMTAALYHTLNHAMFKGLLFMGAGAVLHATHRRDMDEMGGLIHRMPWTAALFLIGCISISALPPFNGFVSEWLTFQAFLLSPSMPNQIMKLLMPMAAALLALTAALVAVAFVKVFGVTFLGHSRSGNISHVHEVDRYMLTGMILSALACLALGILPTVFIGWTDILMEQMAGARLSSSAAVGGWLWLTPIVPERASYSGFIVFLGILVAYGIVYAILHVNPGKIRRGAIWDCGFEKLTNRMQYNSVSFSMPIRRIFGFLFLIKEDAQITKAPHPAFPVKLHYYLRIRDRFWFWLYMPIAKAAFWASRKVGRLQQGRIQSYLIYSFLTIIVLLLVKSL
jgi:formate hydrogenlyase subunit 3/multisubunit Na+/H+ antiporter MnhD subunit